MARPAGIVGSALGAAVRVRRGSESVHTCGPVIGIQGTTLARIERGTHRPSADTARKLATWLGWTIEQVLDAAERPA